MPKSRQDAIFAFQILNYFVGDLVAASQIRRFYQSPNVAKMMSASTMAAANRMCLSSLFLTLVKWTEFYERFHRVVPEDCHAGCKALLKEVERREIRRFRNTFVGHIWDKKKDRPLTSPEIEVAVAVIVEDDEDAFSTWCNNPEGNVFPATVVSIVEHTRDRIREEFSLTDREVAA